MNSRPKLRGVLFNTESKEFRSTEENHLSAFLQDVLLQLYCSVQFTGDVICVGGGYQKRGGGYQFHLDSIIYIDYSFRTISDSIAGASTGNY